MSTAAEVMDEASTQTALADFGEGFLSNGPTRSTRSSD